MAAGSACAIFLSVPDFAPQWYLWDDVVMKCVESWDIAVLVGRCSDEMCGRAGILCLSGRM